MRSDALKAGKSHDMEDLVCYTKQLHFYMEGNGESLKKFKHLKMIRLVSQKEHSCDSVKESRMVSKFLTQSTI